MVLENNTSDSAWDYVFAIRAFKNRQLKNAIKKSSSLVKMFSLTLTLSLILKKSILIIGANEMCVLILLIFHADVMLLFLSSLSNLST